MRDKKGGKDSSKVSEPGYVVCEIESEKEKKERKGRKAVVPVCTKLAAKMGPQPKMV